MKHLTGTLKYKVDEGKEKSKIISLPANPHLSVIDGGGPVDLLPIEERKRKDSSSKNKHCSSEIGEDSDEFEDGGKSGSHEGNYSSNSSDENNNNKSEGAKTLS
jgi:hypothetical protein